MAFNEKTVTVCLIHVAANFTPHTGRASTEALSIECLYSLHPLFNTACQASSLGQTKVCFDDKLCCVIDLSMSA
jgi:hypothetical protein